MTRFRPLLAEFIGTFALIFVGIGAIKTAGHDVLAVALAHGLTIGAFVSATLHISGGQLNPAVTFGLVCGGHMTVTAAIRYWIAQLLGGFSAALICLGLFGRDVVVTGTPQLAINLTGAQGILVEAILTFFLVFVVHGTAVDQRGGRQIAGLAIGSTITRDILFGGARQRLDRQRREKFFCVVDLQNRSRQARCQIARVGQMCDSGLARNLAFG